jgi:hypothetical protein
MRRTHMRNKSKKQQRKRAKTRRRQRGGQAEPKLWFISYGDANYEAAKERIRKEAEDMGCFQGGIKIYGPEDLGADFNTGEVAKVLKEPRGGGYWIWKPYVIMKALEMMDDNDILLYADSGCTLQPAGLPRLKEYVNMISLDTGKSVLVMRLRDQVAKKWITTEILNYFGIQMDDPILDLNQIIGGINMFRKCPESIQVVQRWLDTAMKRPDLFTDIHNEASKKTNPDFIENRHDQSILTPIVQTPPSASVCVIIDEEIEKFTKPKPERPDEFFDDKPILAARKSSG